MSQVMLELGEGDVLPLPHFTSSFRYQGAFFARESIVWINYPLWLYEHAVSLLTERHKVPFLDFEGCEHLARDHHLAPLPHTSDPLLSCGRLRCHTFRLSDYQKL
jgi:hypothetical protein